MYSIVFTKGDNETIIAQKNTLEEARAYKRELEKDAKYHNGLLTIEDKSGKGIKILG